MNTKHTITPVRIATLITVMVVLFSCSTKKNSFTRRVYHNLTSHYNVYWNGDQSLKEGIATLQKNAKDNYSKVLPVFNYGAKENISAISPAMDRTIEKATLTINRHSMFFNKKEYVRWIDDAYFITAKARFYKQDYLMARRTFDYVIKNYPKSNVKWDAMLWEACTYNQLKEYEKASGLLENIQSKVDKENIPGRVIKLLPLIYAEHYLYQQNYKSSIVYLQRGIELNTNRQLVTRLKFILAQVYQQTGNNKAASELYLQVIRRNPPYEMAFNSRINLAKTFDNTSGSSKDLVKALNKMLKDSKNKDFLDQIYFALAEISLKEKNDTLGISYLKKSVAASMQNNYQKAISALRLADLYFEKSKYEPAQMYYDTCMQVLPQDFPDYSKIESRTNTLTDLVKNLSVVQLEDSLQHLATLSEAERNKIIDGIIENYTKEEQRKQEEEKERSLNMGDIGQLKTNQTGGDKSGGWYFYNPQAISFGFTEFIKKWGRRKLEDNWRLSNKRMVEIEPTAEKEINPSDSTTQDSTKKLSTDPKNTQTYAQNIPLTQEKIDVSNAKISEALFNLGNIYLDGLQDTTRSLHSFESYLERFPADKNVLQANYTLYRVYTKKNDLPQCNFYKQKILTLFPESDYAKIIADPDYNLELLAMQNKAEARYAEVYNEFKSEHYNLVVIYCNDAIAFISDKNLVPKFETLRALALGKIAGNDTLVSELRRINTKYPESETFAFTKGMLSYLTGKEETAPKKEETGGNIQGIYNFNSEVGHFYILLVNNEKINVNVLKIRLSDFITKNYSIDNLMVKSVILDNSTEMISVGTFLNAEKAMDFFNNIASNEYVFSKLDKNEITLFAISAENYPVFYKNKDVKLYLKFFNKIYFSKPK
ncbi:MAG: tetratricopeptide repeat protein [Lentimicrobiaceae bacterium]|nr:tetratricopeptide repeat protein [Lentimicrobiaceae bacterium]